MKRTALIALFLITGVCLSAQCANIYFYRPVALTGEKNLGIYFVGGQKLFDLPYGSYVLGTACTEGTYFFQVQLEETIYRDRLDIDVRSGQDYYVRVGSGLGLEIPSIKLQDNNKGLREISRQSGFPQGNRQFSLPTPAGSGQAVRGVAPSQPPTQVAQSLPSPQTIGGFRFTPTAITRSGALLQIDYQIENLTNYDRWLYTGGWNITFYDQAGNLLKGNGNICIMGNCRDYSGWEIAVNEDNNQGRYSNKWGRNSQIGGLIPYGIPVKASVTIGGLRRDSKTLVRGQIFFQGESPTNGNDKNDICLNYGPTLIPETQDATNPLRHNMGNQSVEIREVKFQSDGRVAVSGLWTNRSDLPYTLSISSGKLINNTGTQQDFEQIRFASESQNQYLNSRNSYTVNAYGSLPFTVFTAPSASKVTGIPRLTLQFGNFELTWDNLRVQ